MNKVDISFDRMDAFVYTYLSGSGVGNNRVVELPALVRYDLWHLEWGNLGFIRLRKINEEVTGVFFSYPPTSTDKDVHAYVHRQALKQKQIYMDRLKQEQPNISIDDLLKESRSDEALKTYKYWPDEVFKLITSTYIETFTSSDISSGDHGKMAFEKAVNFHGRAYIDSMRKSFKKEIIIGFNFRLEDEFKRTETPREMVITDNPPRKHGGGQHLPPEEDMRRIINSIIETHAKKKNNLKAVCLANGISISTYYRWRGILSMK